MIRNKYVQFVLFIVIYQTITVKPLSSDMGI